MGIKTNIFAVAALATGAYAQGGAWAQCGGTGFSGPTTCVSGYTCTYSNPYYSQCLPGSGGGNTGGGAGVRRSCST